MAQATGGVIVVPRLVDLAILLLNGSVVPLGRMGQPEEIASAVVWAASDEASCVADTTIVIDGGISPLRQPCNEARHREIGRLVNAAVGAGGSARK